jgi:hypothetical protein
MRVRAGRTLAVLGVAILASGCAMDLGGWGSDDSSKLAAPAPQPQPQQQAATNQYGQPAQPQYQQPAVPPGQAAFAPAPKPGDGSFAASPAPAGRMLGEQEPCRCGRHRGLFPHMIVPLFVGREKESMNAGAMTEDVMKRYCRQSWCFRSCSSRRRTPSASDDDPTPEQIYDIGTVALVLQLLKLPDGTVKVLVEGLERARIEATPTVTNSSRPRLDHANDEGR